MDDHHHDHPHPHNHADDHDHVDHHLEAHRPHEEAVVLEIGKELGALVVYTHPLLLHREIEISPADDDSERSHKDVLERVAGTRSIYAAVFDQLPAGVYTLWYDGIAQARDMTVAGGAVGEVDWTGGLPAAAGASAA